ncbi:hypothetical protein BDZ94DRAFT_1250012 [Collybia nuda]|uniref:Uncharacterized protein n=1 Tax=Collybia nuda TaxID=64659 RepID=A0A9P5YFU9_9AGAR|nr:hypothetical protein BDZ94DRAFT_1250012 [Collybia nuda]
MSKSRRAFMGTPKAVFLLSAAYFSGATASRILCSVPINPRTTIVDTFWFYSLILSIGAAINSSSAMVRKRTFYASRGSKFSLSAHLVDK